MTKYGGQCSCGAQIVKRDGGDWHCPKCHPDILGVPNEIRDVMLHQGVDIGLAELRDILAAMDQQEQEAKRE